MNNRNRPEPAPWVIQLFRRRPDIARMAYNGLHKKAALIQHFGGEK